MPTTARYAGSCQGCPSTIEPGDAVVRTRHGWAHATCTAAVARREWTGHTSTNPAYQSVCPDCAAEPGASCTSTSGKRRALHPSRVRAGGSSSSSAAQ